MNDIQHDMAEMDHEAHEEVEEFLDTMMEIYDELDGAKKYIKAAFRLHDSDRAAASAMATMSGQESGHAEVIAGNATRMLSHMEEAHHPCAGVLKRVWTHVYGRQMEYAAWVKQMQAQYRTMQ